jgi:hypothetical protein
MESVVKEIMQPVKLVKYLAQLTMEEIVSAPHFIRERALQRRAPIISAAPPVLSL